MKHGVARSAAVMVAVVLVMLVPVMFTPATGPGRNVPAFGGGQTAASAVDDDFESYSVGDEAATLPGFTVVHGTDPGKLLTQVSLDPLGVNKCLNLTDAHVADHYDLSKAFLHEYVTGETIPLKIWPVTAGNESCLLTIDLVDSGVDVITLNVSHYDGAVRYYDGSWHVATGFTMTLDAWNWLYINLTTGTTFNLSSDQVAWYGPFDSAAAITDTIDSISFESPADNHIDGTPESGIENFETMTDGVDVNNVVGIIGTWNNPSPASSCSDKFKQEGANLCVEFIDVNAAGGCGDPKYVLSSKGSANGADYLEYQVKVTSYAGQYCGAIMEGATYRIGVYFEPGGHIHCGSGLGTLAGTWVLNTWVTVKILFFSQSQFEIEIDGGGMSAAIDNNNGAWSSTGAIIDTWWHSGSTGDSYAVRVDDIKPSWMYVAPAADTIAEMTTYIDGLGSNLVPDASFSANVTGIIAGQSVAFNHSGSNGDLPATYQWDFGDLTANATAENATHQYTTAGTYTVTLTVGDVDGDEDVVVAVDYIAVAADLSPDATFTANTTSIVAGQSVSFTHAGGNGNTPTTYQWSFGDGTANATVQNPVHQFTTAGSRTITLTITDTDGDVDVYVLPSTITVAADVAPDATFTASAASIIAGQSVTFTHTGSNGNAPATYQWSFGDGTANSTVQDPVHAFTTAGVRTVKLAVTDTDGDVSVYTLPGGITVAADIAPGAAFSGTPLTFITAAMVTFTHTGSNGNLPATYQWNFGDGSANATTENVTHSYVVPGTYTVRLTVTDADGDVVTLAKPAYVVFTDLHPTACFGLITQDATAGEEVFFKYTGSIGNGWNTFTWGFGDGSTPVHALDASHVYAAPGSYTVWLLVVDEDGDSSTFSLAITVAAVPSQPVDYTMAVLLAVIAVLVVLFAAVAVVVRRPRKGRREKALEQAARARAKHLVQEERQLAVRTRGQVTEHPVAYTAVAVAVATVLLYALSIGIAVDAVDGVVIGSLSGTDRINVILALYFVVLGLVFAAAVVATFRSRRGIVVAAFSLWAGGVSALVLEAGTVIAMVPGFPYTWEAFLLVPAVFTYLAMPAGFLVLQAALFITFMVIASKITRIE